MIETADSEMSLFGAALNINQTALRHYCSSLSHSIQLIPVKLQVNKKMHCSHMQWRSIFLPVKHNSHISFKIPVKSVTSLTRITRIHITNTHNIQIKQTVLYFQVQ